MSGRLSASSWASTFVALDATCATPAQLFGRVAQRPKIEFVDGSLTEVVLEIASTISVDELHPPRLPNGVRPLPWISL